jgi:GNAT superfamily N-acetyltransferase
MFSFLTTRNFSSDLAVSRGVQLRSASSPWVRFTWQTNLLPEYPSSEMVRLATKEEAQKVTEVILHGLSMDPSWNDSLAKVEKHLREAIVRHFAKESPSCLVIPKGNRFIAASILDPEIDSQNHLLSGPVVLAEYRNRGIGSQLLHASLAELKEQGVSMVRGVTRSNSVSARHVYKKFGSISEPAQFPILGETNQESKV